METNISDFFDRRIAACCQERERMREEGYGDEADFEQIKANIYDIFKQVLSAAKKKYGDDLPRVQGFFMDRLERIPSAWAAAYEKARCHDDIEAMHIESIKLETVRDIRENIFEGRENG